MFGVVVIFGMNIIMPTMLNALQVNVQSAEGTVDYSVTHISGDAFPQTAADKLQGALRRVAENAQGIDAGANEIKSAADDLAKRTEQQAD